MLKATMKYSALSAKVKALYGKMLSEDDWRHLFSCASVSDIVSFLRNNKDWSETVIGLSSSPPLPRLQTAVLKRVYTEYERLFKFSSLEDKKYLIFTLNRADYGYVLETLRRLQSKQNPVKAMEMTDFMRKHSSVDISALESCTDFQGLMEAVSGSIYEQTLKRFPVNPDTGLPNYRDVETILESQYFKTVFSYAKNDYKGLGKKMLVEFLGTEADLINIVSILRLHRYFPSSLEKANELLIPIYNKLDEKLIDALVLAKTESEALDILRKSNCRRYLEGLDLQKLDSLYNDAMESLCKILIKSSNPSICVPVAYLILREMECKKLNRLIEAVDYGIDPKEVI